MLAMLCSALFLGKSLLPGRALVPFPPEYYDVMAEEALAQGRFDWQEIARGNASMGDKYGQSLTWDRILARNLSKAELSLWNREIGGGVPFVTQMAQPYQPWNLLLLLIPSEEWYGPLLFLHLVLMGFFAYTFARRLGCAHASSMLALVVAVLGLWTQCKIHHNVILTAALSTFPMLSAVDDLAKDRSRGRAIASLGLWSGLSWLSGFIVVALQACYLSMAYALLACLSNPRGHRLGPAARIAAGFALGAVLSLAQMIPLLVAIPISSRPPEFDTALHRLRSLDFDYLAALVWPDLLHWAKDAFYRDEARGLLFATRPPLSQLALLRDPNGAAGNWVECSAAPSIAALSAAVAAFAGPRRRAAFLFGGTAVLGFCMATGSLPFFWIARALPGLSATDLRRQLYFVWACCAVLAALGADRLLEGEVSRRFRVLPFSVAISSALALIALLLASEDSFTSFLASWIGLDSGHPLVRGHTAQQIEAWIRANAYPGEVAENIHRLRLSALRALLASGAVSLALAMARPRALLLLVAAIGELWHAGLGAVQTVPADRIRRPPAILEPVLAASRDPSGVRPRFQRLGGARDTRMAGILLPNLPAYYGVEDAAAYCSLPPARQEEFFLAIEPNRAGKADMQPGGDGVGWFHDPSSLRHPLCDLFGIRFVLTDQEVPLGDGIVDRTPRGTGRFRLLERTTVLPRATFVRAVDVIPDRARRLAELARRDRDVARRVVLEDERATRPSDPDPGRDAEVAVVRHADERVEIHVSTGADGYLRLADAFDPGWRATVDGIEVPVLVADHYLRAVYIRKGDHEVTFSFDAPLVRWPRYLSLSALVAILGLFLLGRRRSA
ncbi:MAG: hypothetical protein Fur0037_21770 [Planctomycetota bacterium]